jgi:hypothetical protein
MPLEKNWLTTEPIDFEFKFYKIKAYQQECLKDFELYKVYPFLYDVNENHQYTFQYLNNKQRIESSKMNIVAIDIDNVKLIQKSVFEHNILFEIDKIAQVCEPILKELVLAGMQIYDEIEQTIIADKISDGIDFRNGYAIYEADQYYIYEYETIRDINNVIIGMEFKDSIDKKNNTIDKIKTNLNSKWTKTIWNFTWKKQYPFKESILPISKRIILKDSSKILKLT